MNYNVIIPAGPEQDLKIYKKIYESFKNRERAKLIWVSGNEKLNQWLLALDQNVLVSENSNRAKKMNLGISQSAHHHIILHHPRSILTLEAIDQFERLILSGPKVWGGFTHRFFDSAHPALKFASWYSNKIRVDLKSVIYLDHCIFFSKDLVERDEAMAEVDIFEDTLFSLKLNNSGPPLRLTGKSQTSAIRFLKKGILKQSILNQVLKMGFALKISPQKMNRIYEKGLWLN